MSYLNYDCRIVITTNRNLLEEDIVSPLQNVSSIVRRMMIILRFLIISTHQPRAPIASMIAIIGINKDSDGFTVAMAAVSTVHRPWLPSGDDDENEWFVTRFTSSLLIVMDNTATFRLFPASILHIEIEGFGVAIATVEGSSAVLHQFFSTIRIVCIVHP